ncbi:MAG: CTP synthetase [Candidatus Puniceispirillum sp.]|nr:CTP synthetase [Candidatus Pelagibacter sp.]MBA4283390.1 CTP synthetase [Candidatus Puniceispirillum sp.]
MDHSLSTSESKFIFITGGVSSSLGKGLSAASLGALLQCRGYSVRIRKLDPYLNIDPGTLSPYQHGEVFVTDDGTEADLDLGHYERFTGVNAKGSDYCTTGKIYSTVLSRERRGDYLGATVQVIPHITDQMKAFILNETDDVDFVICEIGGTVGDIEGLPYLEAIRQLKNDLGQERVMFIHLTLLPYVSTAGELKTKPTQHSVKELLRSGIQADLLLCRSDRPIPVDAKKKLAQFCNVPPQRVIAALDADNIYKVPLQYHAEGFDEQICKYFRIPTEKLDLSVWEDIVKKIDANKNSITIGIVGKYVQLPDAYKSIFQALQHSGFVNNLNIDVKLIDSEDEINCIQEIALCDGVIVAGGFGSRGIQGKIDAIQYLREQKIPTLGICLGMQLSIIEACRNLLGIKDASSTEFGPTTEPVVCLMTEWLKENSVETRTINEDLGGTMRLGAYPCSIKQGTLAEKMYGTTTISERHRHRYEINLKYKDKLKEQGLIFSGLSPDGQLPEILEYTDHPWFIAVQFHPELKSKPFDPHPLFVGLTKAAYEHKK